MVAASNAQEFDNGFSICVKRKGGLIAIVTHDKIDLRLLHATSTRIWTENPAPQTRYKMLEFLPCVPLCGKDFAWHALQHKLQIRHKRQGNSTFLDYESVQRVLLLPAIDDACYRGTDGWGRIRVCPCHRIGFTVSVVSEGKDIAI